LIETVQVPYPELNGQTYQPIPPIPKPGWGLAEVRQGVSSDGTAYVLAKDFIFARKPLDLVLRSLWKPSRRPWCAIQIAWLLYTTGGSKSLRSSLKSGWHASRILA
jgi:hypothetical protein